jgi:ribosomal protein S12 methylthiotransferase accessory factor
VTFDLTLQHLLEAHPGWLPAVEDVIGERDTCTGYQYIGTHRHRSMQQTLELAWASAGHAGISRVADITDLDYLGIPVFNTYRPRAAAGNLTVTCGKGMTRGAALVSALMEAIERHSGEQHGRSGIIARFEDLKHALNPRDLVLDVHSTWSYEEELEWFPARDLQSGSVTLVPADSVFTPYPYKGARLLASNADGLASGNCLAEATLHALYELVERDSRAFGESLQIGREIRKETLIEEHGELIQKFERFGIDVRIFVFASSIGLPTFYALSNDRSSESAMLVNAGAGCHLSPTVALSRALTEAAQSRLSVISGSRENFSARHGKRREETYDTANERAKRWAAGWEMASFQDYEDLSTGNLTEDLKVVLGKMWNCGLRCVLVADLTLGGPDLRIAKVIVPGIEFAANEPSRIGKRFYLEAIHADALRNGH